MLQCLRTPPISPLEVRDIVSSRRSDFQAETRDITICRVESSLPHCDQIMRRFLKNYRERHLHPANLAIHLVALPVTFVLPIHFLVWPKDYPAWWALVAFVLGYALQFIGHAIEGNDAGETILIKRWLGRPYVEFGPRHPSRTGSTSTET